MDKISRGGRVALVAWPLFLALLFAGIAFFGSRRMAQIRVHEETNNAAKVHPDPTVVQVGRTPPKKVDPPEGVHPGPPRKVTVGMYIERISSLSVLHQFWDVEFYLWFRWNGEHPPFGDSFQLIGGTEVHELLETQFNEERDEHYERYLVRAKITTHFSAKRFPFDDHQLTVRIEDAQESWYALEFVADTNNSDISSRVDLAAFDIAGVTFLERPHTYRSTLGELQRHPSNSTHSQFIGGVRLERPSGGWGIFLKMFQGMFAAIAVALLAFFVEPDTGPRFSVGVGAFFASIAATYIVTQQIPRTGDMTLADVLSGLGTLTVFLTIVHSTVALELWERRHNRRLTRMLDRLSFAVIVIGYAAANYFIAGAA